MRCIERDGYTVDDFICKWRRTVQRILGALEAILGVSKRPFNVS